MSVRVDTLHVVHLDKMEVIRKAVDEGRCHCGDVEVEAGSLSTREGSLPVLEYSVGAVCSEVTMGSGSGHLTFVPEEGSGKEDEAKAALEQDEEEVRVEVARIVDFQGPKPRM